VLDRARGAAVAVAAGAVCVSCLVPAFQLAIEAFIGAGAAERGFRYERSVTIVPDSGASSAAVLALGLALVALGIVGAVRGWVGWSSVAAFLLALVLLLLVFDTEDRRLEWPGPHGVVLHEEATAGPLLGDAFEELKRRARRSPEASQASWTLSGGEHGYAARGLSTWRVFLWSTLVLGWLTGYGVLRLRLGAWTSAAIVAVATFAAFVWLALRALGGD
jgi:hypothetical protein